MYFDVTYKTQFEWKGKKSAVSTVCLWKHITGILVVTDSRIAESWIEPGANTKGRILNTSNHTAECQIAECRTRKCRMPLRSNRKISTTFNGNILWSPIAQQPKATLYSRWRIMLVCLLYGAIFVLFSRYSWNSTFNLIRHI